MATIVRTYVHEETGHTINVYESGAEYDADAGRLVKPAAGTVIDSTKKATEYNRRRREKTAAAMRHRITAAMNAGLLPPGEFVNGSAEATAAAGAVLWEDVVMNADAYPRDRILAFETLTKYMGTAPAKDGTDGTDGGTDAAAMRDTARANAAAAAMIAKVLQDVLTVQANQPTAPADVIDGTAATAAAQPPRLPAAAAPAAPPADGNGNGKPPPTAGTQAASRTAPPPQADEDTNHDDK
jgi:hypothetical protein